MPNRNMTQHDSLPLIGSYIMHRLDFQIRNTKSYCQANRSKGMGTEWGNVIFINSYSKKKKKKKKRRGGTLNDWQRTAPVIERDRPPFRSFQIERKNWVEKSTSLLSPSLPPHLPSSVNRMDRIAPIRPLSMVTGSLGRRMSQIRHVWSWLPVAKRRPSGCHAEANEKSRWPLTRRATWQGGGGGWDAVWTTPGDLRTVIFYTFC